jgi:hypothetical protein
MSEFLHPGQHPDADQLSAFAEHVLPGHERVEMLAHLAECADCRQIVFLGQRAQEAQTPLAATPRSRVGWLKLWGRLWPATAALACGLLVAAFLQHRHPGDQAKESDIAHEVGAPVPLSQSQLPHPVVPAVPPSGPALSPKSSTTGKVASSLHPSPGTPTQALADLPRYTAIWPRTSLPTNCPSSTPMRLRAGGNPPTRCPPALPP